MRIEVLVDVKTTLGEGPLWDVEQQRLYWIDSFDGRVFRCTADGREIRAWDVPGKIGSMALRKDGMSCSLFTMIAMFGTPQDITVDELRLETFFPADKPTDQLLQQLVKNAG